MKKKSKSENRGFTLIEMVTVIALMGVLLAIALPMYTASIKRAKEARLHSDLATMNKVIQEYTLDKKAAPQSLEDLVTAHYLKFIPNDITGKNDTWVTEPEDPQEATDPNQPGIGSVHSGSEELSTEGTAYSSW
jgi:general secretion pathway protein G